MRLRLIRNATLHLRFAGGRCVLVDPMLDPAEAGPLVDLPEPAEVVVKDLDAAAVTALEPDRLDATAVELLPADLPVFVRPEDEDRLRAHGFTDVRPVREAVEWDGVRVSRSGNGFVFAAEGEPVLYAGDANGAVAADVVVVSAGADAGEAVALARRLPQASVVVVRLEAVEPTPLTRADLHQRLHEEGLEERITVPEDGAEIPLSPPG
jgi:L-ascorbate metabolism protein UlaG (beta-lactamase superfamily)